MIIKNNIYSLSNFNNLPRLQNCLTEVLELSSENFDKDYCYK